MPNDISVNLKVVTPLFMGGAEPRAYFPLERNDVDERDRLNDRARRWLEDNATNPQIRSQSLRGALRWWLRAILAGADTSLIANTDKLWEKESTVFGSTEQASSVVVKVSQGEANIETMRRPTFTGLDYLFFGMHLGKMKIDGKDYKFTPRRYFAENTELEVTISERIGAPDAHEALKLAAYAMWPLIQLGGLGARNRRGAGSLVISKPLNAPSFSSETLPKYGSGDSLETLRSNLLNGLKLITGHDWHNSVIRKTSSFSVLHPDYCTIILVKGMTPWLSHEDALKQVGALLAGFRSSHPGVNIAAFGLPANINNQVVTGKTRVSGQDVSYTRSSSPLHIRIAKIFTSRNDREYVAVLTLFHTELLPIGASLTNNNKPPDQSAIIQFVDALRNQDEEAFKPRGERGIRYEPNFVCQLL